MLNIKNLDLCKTYAINFDETIGTLLERIKNLNVSNFLVYKEEAIVGIVTEKEIVQAYASQTHVKNPIYTIANKDICTVDRNYKLDNITKIWEKSPEAYIIVLENHEVKGLVTKELVELFKTKLMYQELDQAIEHSPNSIVILDGNGVTLRVNKTYESITGIDRKEALGVDVKVMEAKGMYSPAAGRLVLQEKKRVSVIQKIKNQKEALVTAIPLYDDDGNIFRIIMNSIDLKELSVINKYHSRQKKESSIKKKDDLKIITESNSMKSIISLSDQLKDIDSTVLITGESGVGKGVIARYIHNNGVRRRGRLVEINCGAIPEALLESELLGYESGAFTGAQKTGKQGLIELAHNGTLFLDEIGEMSMQLQVKLLQVIQDKKIIRVGGTKPIDIDTRIIAATNKNLKEMVEQGKFRLDLYYRLNVVPINIPPLSQRVEDLIPMIKHFLHKYNNRYNKEVVLGTTLLNAMLEYQWPGNVRELENTMECFVVLNPSGVIERANDNSNFSDLDSHVYDTGAKKLDEVTSLDEAKREFEKKIITSAYNKYGSSYKVAEALQISQATANRKIREHIT